MSFATTDALSGLAPGSVTAPIALSTDGANQSATGQATDLAGNVGAATRSGINVDRTNPTIAVSVMPAPGANGIYTGPVTAHFTCADTGSGVAACPSDQTFGEDGANLTATGTVTDLAGNTASVTSAAFSLDQTKPTITVALSPAPNSNGYNNGPVTAHFTCSDTGSGIDTCPADQLVSTDGAGQTVSGTAVDQAGNTASVTSDVFNIDATGPEITVSLSPVPNANGWVNTAVTAHFTCFDAGSGIASCPDDKVVNSEGINLTVTGTATDRAGNNASVTSAPFSLDLTGPTITVSLNPPPNTNGWNNAPVTAHFTCTDGGSGVASCPSDQVFATEGAGQPVSGTATDAAGNSASASATVSIDRTPPTITLSPPTTGTTVFTPSVTVSGLAADAGSEIDTATCNGAAATVTAGAISCVVSLTPGSNTVTASVIDRAGNSASASLDFSYNAVPILTILQPANLTYTSISPTTVTGTVDDNNDGIFDAGTNRLVTSDYGWRGLNGVSHFHGGIDIDTDDGDAIHASNHTGANSTVSCAGTGCGFPGHTVIVNRGNGSYDVYAEMGAVTPGLVVGTVIAAGQRIGTGDSGHLHWGQFVTSTQNPTINDQTSFNARPDFGYDCP